MASPWGHEELECPNQRGVCSSHQTTQLCLGKYLVFFFVKYLNSLDYIAWCLILLLAVCDYSVFKEASRSSAMQFSAIRFKKFSCFIVVELKDVFWCSNMLRKRFLLKMKESWKEA